MSNKLMNDERKKFTNIKLNFLNKMFLIRFLDYILFFIYIYCIIKSTLMTSFSKKSNINIIANSILPEQCSLSQNIDSARNEILSVCRYIEIRRDARVYMVIDRYVTSRDLIKHR